MKVTNLLVVFAFLLFSAFQVHAASNIASTIRNVFLGGKNKQAKLPAETIKIIGAGYGRTGTKSLKTALEILGFPTYHMVDVVGAGHTDTVVKAYTGDEPLAKSWFDDIRRQGYNSTVDFPTNMFYKEQMELFPEAKVILTVRPTDKWFKSWTTLMNFAFMFTAMPFRLTDKLVPMIENSFGNKYARNSIPECVPQSAENGWYKSLLMPWISFPNDIRVPDPARCKKSFEDHNAEVQRVVPKEKLLVFEVAQGWEPLCEFLGVPIPNVPFPRTNDSADQKMMRSILMFVAKTYPFLLLGVLSLVGLVLFGLQQLFVLAEPTLSLAFQHVKPVIEKEYAKYEPILKEQIAKYEPAIKKQIAKYEPIVKKNVESLRAQLKEYQKFIAEKLKSE